MFDLRRRQSKKGKGVCRRSYVALFVVVLVVLLCLYWKRKDVLMTIERVKQQQQQLEEGKNKDNSPPSTLRGSSRTMLKEGRDVVAHGPLITPTRTPSIRPTPPVTSATPSSAPIVPMTTAVPPPKAIVTGGDCQVLPPPTASSACRVAMISTWPPARCGIAEFTKDLVTALRALPEFSAHCFMEILPVVSIHDKKENYRMADGELGEPIVDDKTIPFENFYHNTMDYIRRKRFTHVVIQQEFGLTSIQWQLNDIARWLAPYLHVISVVHTPRAYPNIEETGLVRQLADNSKYVVVMSWHAVHSLVHAYGIDRSKIVFIPHGVSLPAALSSSSLPQQQQLNINRASLRFPLALQRSDTLIAVSFGLIHEHKGLHRVIRIMQSLVESVPNFYFVVAGMEHPSNAAPVMPRLFEQAREAGVEQNLLWVNRYLSHDETDWLHRRADVIVSLYDEITPTSGTILKAMSYQKAIIATHYRFASEVLQGGGRGCVVPFEDDSATFDCFTEYLGNASLRRDHGEKAFQFVSRWNWEAVAKEHLRLLFLTAGNAVWTPYLNPRHCVLSRDPFRSAAASKERGRLEWRGNKVRLFDRVIIGPVVQSSTCVLYVDHELQINGKLNDQRVLVAVSVETPNFLVLVNLNGADVEFKPNRELASYETVSYSSTEVKVESRNVLFRIMAVPRTRVDIAVSHVNRFAAPRGVFGDAIVSRFDLAASKTPKADPFRDVHGAAENPPILFTHNFACQKWSFFDIDVNIYRNSAFDLPQGIFSKKPKPEKNVTFTIEGPIFNLESFAIVNRQMFLQLFWTHVRVLLKPSDSFTNVDTALSVDVALVSAAYIAQSSQSLSTDVLFRNAWPPNFQRPVSPADGGDTGKPIVYIHQQPWEFTSIPKSWVPPLQNVVDEIWVPSLFCKDIYAENEVPATKIHVIPHGVNFKKFQLEQERARLPTNKSFVFFFIGGLLPRKGVDLLLKAYSRSFNSNEDVSLLMHTIYGDNFKKDKIMGMLRIRNLLPELQPEIVFHEAPLSWSEYVQILNSVDAFVSPFRSEGFGLTILEAMAKGIAPIIPYFGPPKEFAPNHTAFYVDAVMNDCVKTPPCGPMSMFGEPTVHQPQWGEPSVDDLARQLRYVFEHQAASKERGALARREASKHTWDAVGQMILKRISILTNKR